MPVSVPADSHIRHVSRHACKEFSMSTAMQLSPGLRRVVCWSVVLLSATWTAAVHGETTPPTPTPAASYPVQIELADATLAATAEKRAQLRYLVRCALPEHITVYAE